MVLDERLESNAAAALNDTTPTSLLRLSRPKLAPIASCETLTDSCDVICADLLSPPASQTSNEQQQQQQSTIAATMTTTTTLRRQPLPTTLNSLSVASNDELNTVASSDTLVPSSPGRVTGHTSPTVTQSSSSSSYLGLKHSLAALLLVGGGADGSRKSQLSSHQLNALALSPATSPKFSQSPLSALCRLTSPPTSSSSDSAPLQTGDATTTIRRATSPSPLHRSPVCSPKLQRASSPISYSYSSPNIITNFAKSRASCMFVCLSLVDFVH